MAQMNAHFKDGTTSVDMQADQLRVYTENPAFVEVYNSGNGAILGYLLLDSLDYVQVS